QLQIASRRLYIPAAPHTCATQFPLANPTLSTGRPPQSPPGSSSSTQKSSPMASQARGTSYPKDEKHSTIKPPSNASNSSLSPLTVAGLILLSALGFYATFTAPSDSLDQLAKMKGVDKIVGSALLLSNAAAHAIGIPTRPAKPQKGEFGKLPPMGFNSW